MADNSRQVSLTTFLIIVGLLIVALFTQSIRLEYVKNTPAPIDSTDIKINNINALLSKERAVQDCLFSVLSAKKQEVIINNYRYETKITQISKLDTVSTDSLFEQNLQSGYKRFGWMLN